MMSVGVHLACNGFSSRMVHDGKPISFPASFGCKTVAFSCSRRQKLLLFTNFQLKSSSIYSPSYVSCKASLSKRNPEFSRNSRGSSRSKMRQNLERENPEKLEDGMFSSKNGPIVSLPHNQRYSATATPGHREKEIVELFKKVQAKLRERAAVKEEKRIEAAQQPPGERGTVDSLLKLLRKHSVAQGKKVNSDDGNNLDQNEKMDSFDQPERSDPFEEEQSSSFFESDNLGTEDEVSAPKLMNFSRPTSNFRRRSPVPRVKFQPVFSAEDEGSRSIPLPKAQKKITSAESEPILEPKLELGLEPKLEPEPDCVAEIESFDGASEMRLNPSDISDAEEADQGEQSDDLSYMKLSELRGLAKSRGIKGYSKLKKNELLELLRVHIA
ncbi:SAP-like protein BP-73 [Apostasia shenzhenica]|uniref:SAP-like protein BP-73 n=1 Tax=Apostasia shenzhenica TaxID=1088818 RepID=A0A2I0AUK9_9ASPA|nr:SAP-like protein BP-73 [Apostasia shenzhenica]